MWRRSTGRGLQLVEDLDEGLLTLIGVLQAREIAAGGPEWLRPWKYWGPRLNVLYRALLLASLFTPKSRRGFGRSLEEGLPPERLRHRMEGLRILFLHGGGGAGFGEALYLGARIMRVNEYSLPHYLHAKSIAGYLSEPALTGECLYASLEEARREAEWLWTPAPGVEIVHIFLARSTKSGACRVPRLIHRIRPTGEKLVLDPSDPLGVRRLPPGEEEPGGDLEIPCEGLPEEAPGLHAYLVEVSSQEGRERTIVFLGGERGRSLREWLSHTLERLKHQTLERGAPKHPRSPLYTLRLEHSLRLFASAAERRGCGLQARVLLASAARTLSLLAGYNPLLARVEPARLNAGKPRLPKRPVVLNPYSYRVASSGSLSSIGRGTLASYIAPLLDASPPHALLSPGSPRVEVECGGVMRSGSYHLVFASDPLTASGLVHRFYEWWAPEARGREACGGVELWPRILGDLYSVLEKGLVRRRGYIIVVSLVRSGDRLSSLKRVLSLSASRAPAGLRRLYWLPIPRGPSVLEAFFSVYRVGSPDSPHALEPLEWWRKLAGGLRVGDRVPGGFEAVRSAAERILHGF